MGARSQSTKKQLKPADRHRAFLLERFFDFLTLEKGSSARTQDAYARDVMVRLEDQLARTIATVRRGVEALPPPPGARRRRQGAK